MHRVFFALLYVTGPALLLWLLYLLDQPYELPDSYLISADSYVMSYADAPPSSGWHSFDDASPPARPDDATYSSVWYRFPVPATIDSPTLYLPFPLANLDIWHQGSRLLLLGPMSLPLYHARFPVLIPLPGTAEGGQQTLDVRVARHDVNTRPPATYVAPYRLAKQDFDDQAFSRKWLSVIMLGVMAVFIVFNLGLFLVNRRETAYGWYALTMFLWALHTAHSLVNAIPFHHPLWFAINYVLVLWVVPELIFINRFFSLSARRLERAVVAITLAISLITLAISLGPHNQPMSTFVMFLLIPWALVCTCIVISRYFSAIRKSWTYESVSLWLTSGIFLGVAVRDLLYELNLPGWSPPGSAYYLQYAAAIPMLLFGWHLVRRFAAALHVANLKNAELDQTVAARTADLEESYKKLAVEESRRSLAEERARLMRDMHDGLGGQLIHALALSEQVGDEELQKALRLALDDLRLVVESLSPDQRGLPELVASYRHRVARMLSRTGTRISWEIDDIKERRALSPKHALNFLRILQEAVTNAVRHSGGDHVRVMLSDAAEGVRLRIADNGKGLANHTPGRGIENMRTRAREIGIEINIDSSAGGTTVSCLLAR